MKIYKIAAAASAITLLSAGIVFAQVAGGNGVGVTSNPVTTTVSSGTGVNLGTFTVTGDTQGATLTSIPLTLTANGGATASNLSNCQVYTANGTAVGTAFAPASGSNTFTFTPGLQVGGSAGASNTYTVRCDVANGVPSGSTFQFVAGTPVLGNALNVNLVTPTSVVPGSTASVLGLISLDATHSGGSINVASIPVSITGNGASTSELTNCAVRNIANLGVALNSVTPVQNGSTMSFTLASPLTVPAGTSMSLALTCDVAAVTPLNSSFTVSIAPSGLGATVQSTGAALTPGTSIGTSGSALPTSGVVTVASTVSGTGSTPGLPNTGAGGSSQEVALVLALSALLALGAAFALRGAYRS